ncbi:MAG TPA: hypothetical protein VME46_06595 [Acidimicrobiales bacterium]|nr:hypothetical protein [Acidimicrobiales bacterium]
MFRRPPPAAAVGTYTTWWWPRTASGLSEMAWDLEPRTDPSPAGYFWSHQIALIGGEAAYFGLQTLGSDPTGKIAIFSVWEAVDADGPEYAAPFAGEGTGMSVRIRHEWSVGCREHLVVRADGEGWWRAEVGGVLVGRIRAAPGCAGLASTSIMWTERYGPPMRTCADIGHAVAWFGTPEAGGGIKPRHHENSLGTNRGCPGSSVHDEAGGVVHVVGGEAGR